MTAPGDQRILHVSFTDKAGAGKAALRLCLAQIETGMNAHMLVAHKAGYASAVEPFYPQPGLLPRFLREVRGRALRRKIRAVQEKETRSGYLFSPEGSSYRDDLIEALAESDVIHLHWVARFLFLPLLTDPKLRDKRIVWTLHDFHPITGGCHYPGACERYMSGCGHCPLLKGDKANDLSHFAWQTRHKTFAALGDHLTFVAPSAWLAGQAEQSGVTGGRKVHVVSNPLDLDCFRPLERSHCRRLLGLPEDRPLVLFVSDRPEDQRKGGDLIRTILRLIREGIGAHFVSVGSESAFKDISDQSPLGMITDDRLLAIIYAAADVFLLPSRDDNLPNTAIEALACGTPVVCFDAGGAPELVKTGHNGAVVPPGDTATMATATIELLNEASRETLRDQCRQTAEDAVAPKKIAMQYNALYKDDSPSEKN